MSDTTLTDISKALGFNESNARSTESYFGTVEAIIPRVISGQTTYYYSVIFDGNSTPTECARLVGADVGDRVLVSVLQNGHAVVTSRIDGDLDALDAKRIASKNLIYDHTYEYSVHESTESNPSEDGEISYDVTFTAHLYRAGIDIAATDEIDPNDFKWYYKTEETFLDPEAVDGLIYLGSGRIITIENVTQMIGYGLHVIGRYETLETSDLEDIDYNALTDIDDNTLQADTPVGSGDRIRVRDLEVITSLYSTDSFLVVTESGEKLITKSNLSDAVDKTYVHTQNVVSDIWTITHNLNKHPSVTVVDSAESVVEGDIQYVDNNSVVLTFSGAFSGKAYFN